MSKNLFIVYGKDDFLKELFVKKSCERYPQRLVIDAQETEYKDLLQTLSNRGLYGNKERKIVVVRHAEKLSIGSKKEAALLAKHIGIDVFLYLVFDDVKNSRLRGWLKDKAQEFVFNPLYGYKLRRWVKKTLEEKGFLPTEDVIELLASLEDSYLIYNRIRQMALLLADKKHISVKDVLPLFQEGALPSNFVGIDGVLLKDKDLLLTAVYAAKTESELDRLFYTVVKYWNILFSVRLLLSSGKTENQLKGVISAGFGVHPFLEERILKALKDYPLSFLKKKTPYLCIHEVRLRTAHYDKKDILAKAFLYLFSEERA